MNSPREIALNQLIDRIVMEPPPGQSVQPGQTVRVEVFGASLAPGDVTINGTVGAVQYLQFASPGRRALLVVASAGGSTQHQVATIEVAGLPLCFTAPNGEQEIAMLGIAQSTTQPYEAVLTLGSFVDTGLPGTAAAAEQQAYEWDFGDGQAAITRKPTVRHDYFAGIDHQHGAGRFVVTCTARHSGITVRRSLTIQSAYALCKRRGTIAPHVVADLFARKRDHLLTAAFVVHNVEAETMVLDRLSIAPLSRDPNLPGERQPFVALATPIVVEPKSATLIGVNVPFVAGPAEPGQLAHDVDGFTVFYVGHCGRMPVRCSAMFEVPIAEWSKPPSAPLAGRPGNRPRALWPREMVERTVGHGAATGNAQMPTGGLRIDQQTGTVAIGLGRLGTPAAQAGGHIRKVLAAVSAPAQGDLALCPSAAVEARCIDLEAFQQVARRVGASSDAGVD